MTTRHNIFTWLSSGLEWLWAACSVTLGLVVAPWTGDRKLARQCCTNSCGGAGCNLSWRNLGNSNCIAFMWNYVFRQQKEVRNKNLNIFETFSYDLPNVKWLVWFWKFVKAGESGKLDVYHCKSVEILCRYFMQFTANIIKLNFMKQIGFK